MKSLKSSLALAVVTAALSGGAIASAGLPQLATVQVGPYPVALYNDSATAVTGANTFALAVEGLKPDAWLELELRGPSGERVPVTLKRITGLAAGHSHGEDADSHGGDSHGATSSDSHGASDSHGETAGSDSHDAASTHAATDSHAEAAQETSGAHDDSEPHEAANAHSEADSHAVADEDAAADNHETDDAHSSTAAHEDSDAHASGEADDHSAADTSHAAETAVTAAAAPALSAADQERAQYAYLHAHDDPYAGRGSADLSTEGKWTAVVTVREPGGYSASGSATLEARYGGPNRAYVGLSGLIVFSSLLVGIIGRRRQVRPEGRGARGAR
jgi:hypothetical protein